MAKDAKDFPSLSICGIGDVRGLLGANCRHSIGPGDGRLNPWEKFDSEENRRQEQLEQKQRAKERRIRATKREVQGLKTAMDAAKDPADKAELKAAYQEKARKLREQNKDYRAFCEENDLKPVNERLQIAKWDRKQAASASAAARAGDNGELLQIEKNRAIIKQRVSDGEYNLGLSRQQYLKHIEGTKQFELYLESRKAKGASPQSIITVSEEEAQNILYQLHGTGTPRVRRDGSVANVEFVSADRIVGKWYIRDGQWKQTRRVALHYGKRGSHIVPVEDKDG